jgi:hypothetical protein
MPRKSVPKPRNLRFAEECASASVAGLRGRVNEHEQGRCGAHAPRESQPVGSVAIKVDQPGEGNQILQIKLGSWPNGIKLGRTHDLCHGDS